jgi:hypothetical protein
VFSTRPDAQSFTKFLVTAGVFLIVAAFIVPGLILRETDILKLTQVQLNHATPVGRKELERRQRVARDVGEATPWIAGVLFVGGGVLLWYGAPRLRKQEAAQEERQEAELAELRGRIGTQTPEEQEQKLQEEVEAEELDILRELVEEGTVTSKATPSGDEALGGAVGQARDHEPAGGDASGDQPEVASGHRASAERAMHARNVEARVLERVYTLVPSGYEFNVRARIEGEPVVLVDGLLTNMTGGDARPDVLIEVVANLGPTLTSLKRRLDQADLARLRYQERVRSAVVVWLIAVTGPPGVAPLWLERGRIGAVPKHVVISLIGEHEIETLQVPPELHAAIG